MKEISGLNQDVSECTKILDYDIQVGQDDPDSNASG
jgi:hypothetical protein